jgi:hypothetical protein
MSKNSSLKKSPAVAGPVAASVAGPVAVSSPTSLMRAIDEFGVIKAEEAKLAVRGKVLKAEIEAAGLGGHDGELFHAAVFETTRTSTDDVYKEKVAELIAKHTSPQWRAAHMSESTSTTVKITARSAALVKAGEIKTGA